MVPIGPGLLDHSGDELHLSPRCFHLAWPPYLHHVAFTNQIHKKQALNNLNHGHGQEIPGKYILPKEHQYLFELPLLISKI